MTRALAVLALAAAPLAAAAPVDIPHQGRLLDDAGVPLDGEHALTFALYDAPSGGNRVWSETQDVPFADGYYATSLGRVEPLDAGVFDGEARYLSLSVDGGPELSPRRPVHSVPYAVRALTATHVDGTVNATELLLDGVPVVDASGNPTGDVTWDQLLDAPDVLGRLGCAEGDVAVHGTDGWTCAPAGEHAHDAADLVSGRVDVARLPVGTGADDVAAGKHSHAPADLTGVLEADQLPVGDGAGQVAAGDHGHHADDVTDGVFSAERLPVGDGPGQVAAGDHDHPFVAPTDDTGCEATNEGALRLHEGRLQLCAGEAWQAVRTGERAALGQIPIPVVSDEQPLADWTQVNDRKAVGLPVDRYRSELAPGQTLEARLCVSYSDAGTDDEQVQLRLRDYRNADVVHYETSFRNSWSGAGLVRNMCAPWEPAETFAVCTFSWDQSCVFEVKHSDGDATWIGAAYVEVSGR